MASSSLLGTVILVRHGDRRTQYVNPETLDESPSGLTPLGSAQMNKMGRHIVDTYGLRTSPTYISGLGLDPYISTQVIIRADAGDDGGVTSDSTVALTQGIWRPSSGRLVERLANGTTVQGAMSGYQYVQIKSIDPSQDVTLEGWTSCPKLEDTTSKFRTSDQFNSKKKETEQWFSQLTPWLDGRLATLDNIYNVHDYMSFQYVHNTSYAAGLPDGWMSYARSLANWHENSLHSASDMSGIGNIAGRTVLSSLRSDIQRIANLSDPLRLVLNGVSHQPFISLFSMFGVAKTAPELEGIVNYGSALAFEVWGSNRKTGTMVRMRFMNGTDEGDFARYSWLDTDGDVPIKQFMDETNSASIDTMAEWCNACGNKVDRGCGALNLAEHSGGHGISRVAAGAVGAACTLALAAAVIALLFFLGLARFGRSRVERRRSQGSTFNRKNSQDADAFPLGVKDSFATDRSSITKVPV